MAASVVWKAVMRMTGKCGLTLCNCSMISKPLSPGICRSVTTTSQRPACALASPCAACVATSTVKPSSASRSCSAEATDWSSSIKRILDMSLSVGDPRQDDTEDTSAAQPGLEIQQALVLVDDLCRDGQAQTGTIFLRAEERVKQSFLNFRGDAGAGVFDFQDDRPGGLTVQAGI